MTPCVTKQARMPKAQQSQSLKQQVDSKERVYLRSKQGDKKMGEQASSLLDIQGCLKQTKKGLGKKLQLHLLVLLTYGYLF